LTNCGLSLNQIAIAVGLFEHDVRRIVTGQQEPSDAVTLLISSTLDSLTAERGSPSSPR
jgi:plasmid maintenance system antidote protein VapI